MGKGEKVALGVLAVGVLGVGAWALWPKAAAPAASASKGGAAPTTGTPVPIVLTDVQAAGLTGLTLAANQPLILNLSVAGGGAAAGGADWTIQLSGGVSANDQGISQAVHTFTVMPQAVGNAVVTATMALPNGTVVKGFSLAITVAPTTQSFAPPAGVSGLPRMRHPMRQALQA